MASHFSTVATYRICGHVTDDHESVGVPIDSHGPGDDDDDDDYDVGCDNYMRSLKGLAGVIHQDESQPPGFEFWRILVRIADDHRVRMYELRGTECVDKGAWYGDSFDTDADHVVLEVPFATSTVLVFFSIKEHETYGTATLRHAPFDANAESHMAAPLVPRIPWEMTWRAGEWFLKVTAPRSTAYVRLGSGGIYCEGVGTVMVEPVTPDGRLGGGALRGQWISIIDRE